VPRKVSHSPKFVWLALKNGHKNPSTWSQQLLSSLQKPHNKILVGAHLAIDIRAAATHVRKVKNDVVESCLTQNSSAHVVRLAQSRCVNLIQDLVATADELLYMFARLRIFL
jgi:hypothetical protein